MKAGVIFALVAGVALAGGTAALVFSDLAGAVFRCLGAFFGGLH
jgi:hypothetical protein